MGEAFRRLRAATSPPSGADVLADLIEFHTARPGVTEATLGECTLADGRTGYDLLAGHLPEGARDVLDLGAGNGPLLVRLLARTPRLERVIGVDACASDLALARQRSGADERVVLLAEAAQDLSLPDASLCAVLSHHAFYLMRPIEPVVAQIARVLRPAGLFAFVTWSARSATLSPFAELMNAFSPLTRRDNPHFQGWGDPRAFSLTGLEELLIGSGLFQAPLSWDEHDLSIVEPADRLCERLMGFFYSVELQRAETRAELRRVWTEILSRSADSEGRAHLRFPFACVRAWRVNAGGGA